MRFIGPGSKLLGRRNRLPTEANGGIIRSFALAIRLLLLDGCTIPILGTGDFDLSEFSLKYGQSKAYCDKTTHLAMIKTYCAKIL